MMADVEEIEVVVSRCLSNVRWLVEHGFGAPEEFPEVAVLRSLT